MEYCKWHRRYSYYSIKPFINIYRNSRNCLYFEMDYQQQSMYSINR